MLEKEHEYDGFNLVKSTDNVKMYQKYEESNPTMPFIRLEMETKEVFPD